MNIKLEIIFLIFTGMIVLISVVWAIRTEKRLKRFFWKKGRDLEESIVLLEENISKLKSAKENTEKELVEVNKN